MDKGRLEEAEELLQTALALYPREILMDEDLGIDASIIDSFESLFSNIRDRLETIQALKGGGSRPGSLYVTSLRDLVEMNVARKREAPVEPAPSEPSWEPLASESAVDIPVEIEEPPLEPVEEAPALSHEEPFVEEEFPEPEDVMVESAEIRKEPEPVTDIGAEFDSGVMDAAEKASGQIEPPDVELEAHGAEPAEEDALMEEAIDAAMSVEARGETAAREASKAFAEDELSPEETVKSVSDLADHIAASLKHPPADGYVEMSPRDAAVKAVADAASGNNNEQEEVFEEEPRPLKGDEEAYTAPPQEPIYEKSAAVSAAEAASAEAEALAAQAEAAVAEAEAEENQTLQAAPEPVETVQTEQSTEEDLKSEMPTQPTTEKTNPFKALTSRLASFKSLFTKKKKQEEPKAESVEEPAVEAVEQTDEVAAAPIPAEEPPAPAPAEPMPQDDKDDEALLDEDEMRKLKERAVKKQPISVSTPINASGIFGTILVALMFIIGGYLLYQSFTATSELEAAYIRGSKAAQDGNNSVEYAVAYQGHLGGTESADSATAYVVAGWGDKLLIEKGRQADAVALLSVFRKQGLASAALDDEFANALIETCSEKLRKGDDAAASRLFADAVDMLKNSSLPEARANGYRVRLARIGYALASQDATGKPASEKNNPLQITISRMIQLRSFLNDKERTEIQRKADQIADSILAEGQAALKKNDAALAVRLASQALEMNPNLRAATALLKSASEKKTEESSGTKK